MSHDPKHGHSGYPWSWVAIVVAVTALAAVARWLFLDHDSFWYDEAVADRLARGSWVDLIPGRVKDNGNPPLYWVAAHFWRRGFGDSESAYRSLSALCGAATVPILAWVGLRLGDPRAGLVAALLLAASPMHIELSNEARPYALVGLLVVIQVGLFLRWRDRGRGGALVAWAVLAAAGGLTHYFALAIPLACGISLLGSDAGRRLLPRWILGLVIAAVLGAFWLPAFVQQLGTPGNLSRMGDRWPLQFLSTPLVFGLGRTFAWRDSGAAVLILGSALAIVGFWLPAGLGLADLGRLRRWPDVLLLGGWTLIPILAPLAVALLGKPLYATRYAVVGLPGFLLLTAIGLVRLPQIPRWVLIGLIAGSTSVSLHRYATLPLKDDWRSAAAYLVDHRGPDEPIFFDAGYQVSSYLYYQRRLGGPVGATFGLEGDSRDSRGFRGVLSVDGKRVGDGEPTDGSVLLRDHPAVWLAACVPGLSPQEHEARFREWGFRPDQTQKFHRIVLIRYLRPGRGARRPGSVRQPGGSTP